MSAEDEMGKVAALCIKALLEFLGHLALLLFRLATALIGKIGGFLERTRGPKQQESTARKGEILKWFQ
ncbi:MAG: hypothetical protein HOA16_13530 [Opitutae bacterium]|nr:hypothetical protein [Opitutae bacterium]